MSTCCDRIWAQTGRDACALRLVLPWDEAHAGSTSGPGHQATTRQGLASQSCNCTHRRESAMVTICRSRSLLLGSAVVLAFTLLAPVGQSRRSDAEDVAALARSPLQRWLAPVATTCGLRAPSPRSAPCWSGDIGSMQEEVCSPSWPLHPPGTRRVAMARWRPVGRPTQSGSAGRQHDRRGDRVLAAQQALQSPDLGSLQEEALFAVVAAGSSWDETSGYGSVEASRATIGHPATSTTQVSSDVR